MLFQKDYRDKGDKARADAKAIEASVRIGIKNL